MDECVFCTIGSGQLDSDLAVFPAERVYVLPALRQRPRNRGHALVLPVPHVRNLHDADPVLLAEIMTVTARLTAAFADLYGAVGSFVFQNNAEPDGLPFHLHVHAVPRFDGDEFRTPDPGNAEVPRAERLAQARVLRELLR
jgi:diadenosine tetraphosphate (Ap4A) HIT family hydrolase